MANLLFDTWTRHPAAFSPATLEAALDAARTPIGGLVVDPFVGSGRSGTFITGLGDQFVGIEAHILSASTAAAKLARPASADNLRAVTAAVCEQARSRRPRIELAEEDEVARRFLPASAHQRLAALRDAIEEDPGPWADHLRCALLSTLRETTGPGWPYPRLAAATSHAAEVPVFDRFAARAQVIADDLAAAPRQPRGYIIEGDARNERSWASIGPGSAAACVSSPPYLNQLSYAESSRIELHFLRLVSSWAEMKTMVSSQLVASCTQQTTSARSRQAWDRLENLPGAAALCRLLSGRLLRAQEGRARPKRYDLLVPAYLVDIADVLKNLFRSLAPGARAAWVVGDSAPYGIYVDTPALIGVLAEEIGFRLCDDVHLRERGARWPGVGGRHAAKLSERLIVFERPAWGEQQRLPGL